MPNIRVNVSSGSESEEMMSHSRAVKVGDTVYFSGTTGMNYETGKISADPVEQFQQMMRNVEDALVALGGSLRDIVQTTVLVTSREVIPIVGPHFREMFKDIRPTTEWPVVTLAPPEPFMMEICLTAVLGCEKYDPVAVRVKRS